jgi:rubrerythrin
MVEKKIEKAILTAQRSEITEHFVYQKLSQSAMDPHNQSVLKQISDDELKHYHFWKKYTRQDAKPSKLRRSIKRSRNMFRPPSILKRTKKSMKENLSI